MLSGTLYIREWKLKSQTSTDYFFNSLKQGTFIQIYIHRNEFFFLQVINMCKTFYKVDFI